MESITKKVKALSPRGDPSPLDRGTSREEDRNYAVEEFDKAARKQRSSTKFDTLASLACHFALGTLNKKKLIRVSLCVAFFFLSSPDQLTHISTVITFVFQYFLFIYLTPRTKLHPLQPLSPHTPVQWINFSSTASFPFQRAHCRFSR